MTDALLEDYLALLDKFMIARPTYTWVKFHSRRVAESGFRVRISRQGEKIRGSVVLKYRCGDGRAVVLFNVASPDGRPLWMRAHGVKSLAETAAQRRLDRWAAQDPDLWVLEIEESHPVPCTGSERVLQPEPMA